MVLDILGDFLHSKDTNSTFYHTNLAFLQTYQVTNTNLCLFEVFMTHHQNKHSKKNIFTAHPITKKQRSVLVSGFYHKEKITAVGLNYKLQ